MKKLNIVQYEDTTQAIARANANSFIATLDPKYLISVNYTTTIKETEFSPQHGQYSRPNTIIHTFTIVYLHPIG